MMMMMMMMMTMMMRVYENEQVGEANSRTRVSTECDRLFEREDRIIPGRS